MLDPALEDPYFASSGAGVRGDPMMRGDPMVTARRAGLSPNPAMLGAGPMGPGPAHSAVSGQRDMYIGELQSSNSELQRDLGNLRKELELTNQKLGSSMHSIKTFWSPELKKERALRKEESAKYSLINDQLKLLNSENQVSPITSHPSITTNLLYLYHHLSNPPTRHGQQQHAGRVQALRQRSAVSCSAAQHSSVQAASAAAAVPPPPPLLCNILSNAHATFFVRLMVFFSVSFRAALVCNNFELRAKASQSQESWSSLPQCRQFL
jgi:hypothetical protein